ncbi:lysine (K)-specific demethylase 5Ba [Latimeria chalumnae]|uniref:lysine (K)-specific demethylase 5Ba n=1 Tax=Latimeria chalumnae TaxID=7897 RepID=UPI0006D90A9B|nr:PREDICTED: lysine-specific demethylase 5B isoform X3 [Latimeria chalumnae]|eukprot:XP_014352085.1 PREDICTED: lysine-specific demethylase 5B isoform X3 [Latimeria chalumnae]
MASEFIPPPECPVFEPSWEEFADPFAFINKIRPIVEKTGICKVRPPPDWQPPFACDVDSLHFTPRIQRLNELEAQTRVKLNFLDQIAKFWELQGCTLKIPHVERKILDLYQLNRLVAEEGGFDLVCKERKWTRIALKMGFAPGKAVGSHIRAHYERILYPYNLFQSGASLLAPDPCSKLMRLVESAALEKCVQKPDFTNDSKDKEYKPHDIAQRQSVQVSETCTPARRAKRMRAEAKTIKTEPGEVPESRSHNLRRRMGATPIKNENAEKEIHIPVKQEPAEKKERAAEPERPKTRNRKSSKAVSRVDMYTCLVCGSGNDEDRLLLCDGCDDSYHIFCLIPPLHDVPKGDWRCPKCLAQECNKPQEAFGFEQASRDYTLRSFGEMADSFKSDYFNMPVHMVPTELVEKEFWRLVSTIEEDVTVEYGADIASKEFGSGFPVREGKIQLTPEDEEYIDSAWNLNNMPVMEPSVLGHITADICGMKLPWLYVGMCFSSFCWHIEDHWSYSINYLHWGEPKTWYGAPGYAADQFEDVMMKLVPELFESQPDLLHQLVTIMNPNSLMAHGVPIYRTNQCAGEFVITFPRAYHSGFNQGFNFAEAVNFCTVDWLPIGRQCVKHYSLLNRYCVFSHDEMICKMACKAEMLDVVLASTVQKDMAIMIEEEKALREAVRKMGVIESKRMAFELLPDDERQCIKCKTTCFMSALSCPCRPGELACLYHGKELCCCPPHKHTLRYRYTLDDLYPMMNALKLRAESYDDWANTVSDILEAKLNYKKSLLEFRALIEESERKSFPDNDLLRHLRLITQDAEKCASVAQQLLNGKRQTRYRSGGGKSQNQLTLDELRCFVRQLYSLPCIISQAPLLKELLNRVDDFQHRSEKALSEDMVSASELQALLDVSFEFDVELPQLPVLRERLEQARWLEEVQQASCEPSTLTLDDMRKLIDLGVGLSPHTAVEKAMARLQELLTISEHWEDKARSLIKARPRHSLAILTAAVKEIEDIPAYLPSGLALKDAVQRAKDWLQEVEALQAGGRVPVLDTLMELVSRGRAIAVHLDPLPRLESLVSEVHAWKECAANTFLLTNSPFSLLEVLCPRCDVGATGLKRKQKKPKEPVQSGGKKRGLRLESLCDLERALTESKDTAAAMATLSEARSKEMEALRSLRAANEAKLFAPEDDSEVKVCVCQKIPAGPMVQCELCRGAFHNGCVFLPSNQQSPQVWLCPECHRSQKPPLEKILPLLASLQRIRVRLPEGDALRYVIERTVNWQHRAQHMLASGNLRLVHDRVGPSQLHHRWQSTASHLVQINQAVQTTVDGPFSSPPDWDKRITFLQPAFSAVQNGYPLHGLSPELEELLIEAQLLQVSLLETQELYQMLLTKRNLAQQSERNGPTDQTCEKAGPKQHHTQERSPPRTMNECCSFKKEPTNAGEKKHKRRLEKDGLSGDKKEKAKKPGKPRKKKLKLNEEKRKEVNSGKMEKEREKLFEVQRQSESHSGLSDQSYSELEDSEDDNAICPAEKCQQPEGDEVDWVQCDGSCNQWFHQVCVGVSPEMAEKEDYICVNCTVKDGRNRK